MDDFFIADLDDKKNFVNLDDPSLIVDLDDKRNIVNLDDPSLIVDLDSDVKRVKSRPGNNHRMDLRTSIGIDMETDNLGSPSDNTIEQNDDSKDNFAKILLLGKTGVGKSSFINYFPGKNVAKAASGKPVTRELFFPYEITGGRYPVEIFDTRGLEALDAKSQLDEIVSAVRRRNNSDDIFNWFHTIFYCISMSNPRFEDFEANFIRRLQNELTQHIHIILTHCDTCSAENIAHMRQRIAEQLGNQQGIEVFEVVCVNKKKRNGQVVEPHGKEAVSERVFDLLLEDIAHKLSASYAKELYSAMVSVAGKVFLQMEKTIDRVVTFDTLIRYIQNESEANAYVDNILSGAGEELERDMASVQEKANEKLKDILKPAARLYQSYRGIVTESFVEDALLGFDDMSWAFDMTLSDNDFNEKFIPTLFPNLFKNGYVDRSGDFSTPDESFFGIIGAIVSGIGDVFSLKPNMKKACRAFHLDYLRSLPSEHDLQQMAYERIVRVIGD